MEIGKFNFWCPVEISKAIDPNTGEEQMLLGGIASTADEDSDGEFLDPKGFDIKPLLKSGMVNWHHQAKTCPGTIVGEPTKAEIRKDGLYIETKLYPSSSVARDIWQLAQTLEEDSSTRRLGYSIEGKVLERKSNDKSSPDYKKITKAVITGVAITHQPKNPKTFANIIKGEIDDLEEEDEEKEIEKNKEKKKQEDKYYEGVNIKEKSLDTTEGKPLIKEDLDRKLKNVTFGKSEVMERLFQDIPGISIEKAKEVYNLIQKISNMKKKNSITEEDIQKAYDALGLDPETLVKGDTSEEDEARKPRNTTDDEDEDVDDEDEDEVEDDTEDEEETDEDEDEEDDDDSDEDDTEEEKTDVKKGGIFDRFNRIEKALATSHFNNAKYIKALGVMVKASNDSLEKAINSLELANQKIDELNSINKAQEETISELSQRIESFGNGVPMPKSVRHAAPVERNFNKGNENDFEKGGNGNNGNIISISNKPAISNILDQATFAKGYDDEFSKACLNFEATGNLPANIISRLKTEYNISIVK